MAKHISRGGSNLPCCHPHIRFESVINVYEQVAQLDAGPQHAPELKHSEATAQPAKHRNLVGYLLRAVQHADTKEDAVRLRGDTMHQLAKGCIHPVGFCRQKNCGFCCHWAR